MSEEDSKAVKDYCTGTVFTDETGNDEAMIYNMRAMAFMAGIRHGRNTRSEKPVTREMMDLLELLRNFNNPGMFLSRMRDRDMLEMFKRRAEEILDRLAEEQREKERGDNAES